MRVSKWGVNPGSKETAEASAEFRKATPAANCPSSRRCEVGPDRVRQGASGPASRVGGAVSDRPHPTASDNLGVSPMGVNGPNRHEPRAGRGR